MARQLLLRTIIWSELTLLSTTVTAGAFYITTLAIKNTQLTSLTEPVAFTLASVTFYFFLLRLVASGIARIVIRATYPKDPVSLESRQRLGRLGPEALQKMNVTSPVQFRVGRRFSGALLRKNYIVVGEQFLQQASDDEVIGVIGHEAGHLIMKDRTIRKALYFLPILAFIVILAVTGISDPSVSIAIITAVAIILAKIPLNWRLEYRADLTAANRLGPNTMIATLEELSKTHFDGISFSHPSLSKRIRRLQPLQTVLAVSCPQ